MAASFASASSQRVICATHPLTAYPYSVGVWVYPTTTGTLRTIFSLSDTAVLTQTQRFYQTAANTWGLGATAGAAENAGAPAGTVTANQWAFMVGRFISATNRRLDVLQFDGSVANATGSTSRAFPTSAETIALGSTETSSPGNFFDGSIGEFWYTATDIQADGAALQNSTLRQLAYGGPFSIPHIAKDIIEYRSFRKYPSSEGDEIGQVYHGSTRQTWSNVNGVTIGAHPPLPYWYVNPAQNVRNLTV